jgi:hypothetical protein
MAVGLKSLMVRTHGGCDWKKIKYKANQHGAAETNKG